MKIYLAARYDRRKEMRQYADELRQMGHVVTSRWLEGNQAIPPHATSVEVDALRRQFAFEDLDDLEEADTCISFTELPDSGSTRGGRHVEFGYGLRAGKEMICVGPLENVFHTLVDRFETWEQARSALAQREKHGKT